MEFAGVVGVLDFGLLKARMTSRIMKITTIAAIMITPSDRRFLGLPVGGGGIGG